jgi:predicted transcriptional regulator
MLAYMKRTTIKLPDQLDARLRHEAERRGITISELTREAIEAHLSPEPSRRVLLSAASGSSGEADAPELDAEGISPTPRRQFLSAGAGASGYTDTAARIAELLAEGGFGSPR